ncbi:hypothetical protein DITRI_Ditri11bG0134800 [Diplodiscus trichospermus]
MDEKIVFNFKRPSAQSYTATISTHCQFKLIKEIERVLTKCNELETFRTSCFGHFLGFPRDMKFSSQLVHAVLAREIVFDGAHESEMWFGIGSGKARFSKQEFCLVTGLSFATLSNIFNEEYAPINGGIHERYFGKEDVKANVLWERFSKGEFDQEYDAVKMALVFFVENILFGQDYRKKVSSWLWTLVEDLNEFNKFGWGRYVYKMTVHYMTQGIREPPRGKTVSKYNLYGFSWAFQVGFLTPNGLVSFYYSSKFYYFQIWALEAIPRLGEVCACKISSIKHPRFLNWQRTKKHAQFESYFTNDLIALPILEPTADEKAQWYWRHIHEDLNDGPQYIPSEYNFVVAKTARREIIRKSTVESVKRKRTSKQLATAEACAKTNDYATSFQHDPQLPTLDLTPLQANANSSHHTYHADEHGQTFAQEEPVHKKAHTRRASSTSYARQLGRKLTLKFRKIIQEEVALISKALHEEVPALLKKAVREEVAFISKALHEEVPTLVKKTVHEEVDALIKKNLAKFFRDRFHIPVTVSDDDQVVDDVDPEFGQRHFGQPHLDEQAALDNDIDETPMATPDVKITVYREGSSVNVQSRPSLNILYKDNMAVRNKKMSQYLESLYVNYDEIKRNSNDLQIQYMEFKKGTQHRYVGLISYADAPFFREFEDTSVWMRSDHMDAYMCMLVKRITHGSEVNPAVGKFCILDSNFYTFLEKKWKEYAPDREEEIDDILFDALSFPEEWTSYVRGEVPDWAKPWWDVDHVLLVCNVNGCHWVTCKIDLKAWVIYIYDSLAHKTEANPEWRERDIMGMRRLLPVVMHRASYFKHAGIEPRYDMFGAVRVPPEDVANQEDSNSCGMFSLVFMDFILKGRQVAQTIGQNDIAELRSNIALQIFANSINVE